MDTATTRNAGSVDQSMKAFQNLVTPHIELTNSEADWARPDINFTSGGKTGAKGAAPTKADRPTTAIKSKDRIDEQILRRSIDIVASIVIDKPVEMQISLESLSGLVFEMWDSIDESDTIRTDLLAFLQNAVISADRCGQVTEDQLRALAETLNDLGRSQLTKADITFTRERLREVGFGSLAFLGGATRDDTQ